jgi:outer membrane protein
MPSAERNLAKKETVMKQLSRIVSASLGIVLASALYAQAPAGKPATQNIMTISFNDAVLHTAESQRALSSLQAKFAPRQAQLQALNEEVEALRKQGDNTNPQASDADKAVRAEALNRKERQLQRQADEFKTDSQAESQEEFQRVAQKVFAFLQTYAKQRGYTAVIERGSDASPVIWYAANDIDITEQVTKAYDAQSGTVTSPSTSSPPGTGATRVPASLPESPSPRL